MVALNDASADFRIVINLVHEDIVRLEIMLNDLEVHANIAVGLCSEHLKHLLELRGVIHRDGAQPISALALGNGKILAIQVQASDFVPAHVNFSKFDQFFRIFYDLVLFYHILRLLISLIRDEELLVIPLDSIIAGRVPLDFVNYQVASQCERYILHDIGKPEFDGTEDYQVYSFLVEDKDEVLGVEHNHLGDFLVAIKEIEGENGKTVLVSG